MHVMIDTSYAYTQSLFEVILAFAILVDAIIL